MNKILTKKPHRLRLLHVGQNASGDRLDSSYPVTLFEIIDPDYDQLWQVQEFLVGVRTNGEGQGRSVVWIWTIGRLPAVLTTLTWKRTMSMGFDRFILWWGQ